MFEDLELKSNQCRSLLFMCKLLNKKLKQKRQNNICLHNFKSKHIVQAILNSDSKTGGLSVDLDVEAQKI